MIEKCTCNRREKIDFSIKQRMNECSFVQRHIQHNPTPENPISYSCPQLTTTPTSKSATTTTQIHPNNNNNNNKSSNSFNYNCTCNRNCNYLPHHQHHLNSHYNHHQNIGRECICTSSGSDSFRHFNYSNNNKHFCSIQPPHHWPTSSSAV